MILFFAPAGAGKSIQGQMLEEKTEWKWLSMGQLLRDAKDKELHKIMQTGKLVPDKKTNEIFVNNLKNISINNEIILDGYPRNLEQARWLIDNKEIYNRPVNLVIVLEVNKAELIRRLELRGRTDDTPKSINKRLFFYEKETNPIFRYLKEKNIKIAYIDGLGTPEQVHDRIMDILFKCKLI